MKTLIIIVGCLIILTNAWAQELIEVVDLSGPWKFSIGDNSDWKNKNLNDQDWDILNVPGNWENQGFHGYDGFAWYRTKFKIPSGISTNEMVVELGYIDDIDEVYLNGVKIGSTGSFPPNAQTAYNIDRKYPVPSKLLVADGINTLAVKVCDIYLEGGIIRGPVRLLANPAPLNPEVDLLGKWDFHTGDLSVNQVFDGSSHWGNILVPGFWEDQGYKNYDGFAWYKKEVIIEASLCKKDLVLVLGKIDDIDQVYINGILVGSTGDFPKYGRPTNINIFEYKAFRGYYLPKGIFKPGNNTIAVRVFDNFKEGGIYQGPTGITTQENYIRYWRSRKNYQN